jgi:hypothetical protein
MLHLRSPRDCLVPGSNDVAMHVTSVLSFVPSYRRPLIPGVYELMFGSDTRVYAKEGAGRVRSLRLVD